MQPEGPYRFTHALGGSPVGKAWAAIDDQGRFVTVAVLDAAVAAAPGWREAFAGVANSLSQAPDGLPYTYADFAADAPWVAYAAEAGPGAERLFRALGVEYTPTPTTVSPTSAPPVSAPPQPVPGAPESASGVAQVPWAVQANPIPGQPVSAAPHPISGAPASPAAPSSRTPVPHTSPADVPPQDPFASPVRRITPSERPPQRTGLWIAAGALALTLVAGIAGYALAGSGETEPAAGPSPSASLPPYEATQFSINKAKFEGELAPLAEPWLTRIGGCAADSEVGGPKLPADEERHVFCRYGGASLHFALYPARAQKDAARAYRQQLNLAGGALAPGLREATRANGGVTSAPGSYVEYAFKGEDGRTICGIWWDRDDSEAAFYVETLCEAGNWDALRDLWRRNS